MTHFLGLNVALVAKWRIGQVTLWRCFESFRYSWTFQKTENDPKSSEKIFNSFSRSTRVWPNLYRYLFRLCIFHYCPELFLFYNYSHIRQILPCLYKFHDDHTFIDLNFWFKRKIKWKFTLKLSEGTHVVFFTFES